MKTYNIYPSFYFQIKAKNEKEAHKKATEILEKMKKTKNINFEFHSHIELEDIEED